MKYPDNRCGTQVLPRPKQSRRVRTSQSRAMARPGISLQELKGRFELSDKLLDVRIAEEHLRKASRIIDDHETLGLELGLTSAEMTAISSEKTLQLKRLAMLTKWKQKFAWKATYYKLIDALLKCTRADLAQEVCELQIMTLFS